MSGAARRPVPRAGSAAEAVGRVLWAWRREHGRRPGQEWDPNRGAYVWPADQSYRPEPCVHPDAP